MRSHLAAYVRCLPTLLDVLAIRAIALFVAPRGEVREAFEPRLIAQNISRSNFFPINRPTVILLFRSIFHLEVDTYRLEIDFHLVRLHIELKLWNTRQIWF